MNIAFKYVTEKTLKFGLAGAIGAGIGNAVFEFFPKQEGQIFIDTIMHVSLWAGIIGIGTSIALQIFQNLYLKKDAFSKSMLKTLFRSFIIGGLIGGLAQIIFSLAQGISDVAEIISCIICWGIFGLGIGWSVSRFIPNFPKKWAIIAGLIGGIIGGTFFRLSFEIMPDTAGRLLGVAILVFFGLVISYLEETLREAWLTVVWAKNETTLVAIGTREIILGSSTKADIYLPIEKNYPAITAIIELKNNKIFIDNKIDYKKTELKDGSKITMGSIEIIVNTKTTKSN